MALVVLSQVLVLSLLVLLGAQVSLQPAFVLFLEVQVLYVKL